MTEKEYTLEEFRLAVLDDIKVLGSQLEDELKSRRWLLIH